MAVDTHSQLLTVKDVAARLKLHPQTVRNMGRRGDLTEIRLGQLVRFRASDVDDLITARAAK